VRLRLSLRGTMRIDLVYWNGTLFDADRSCGKIVEIVHNSKILVISRILNIKYPLF
jgi:hypothetical protein